MADSFPAGTPDLSRESDLPAHMQIEQWLMKAISKGDLVPGDKLPREQQLATTLGVSRMTLRQSLASLAGRGVLKRKPGRTGGTFIAQPKIECDLTGLAGFTEQMRRAHLRAGARRISASTRPAIRAAAQALRLEVGAPVHEVVRVRSGNGEPLALERSYFPADTFPDLLSHRLSGSIYDVLTRRYGQTPYTAEESLESVIATPDEAGLLGIQPGAPLMLIERTAFTAAGLPVEFARDLFRSDRIRISVRTGIGDAARMRIASTVDTEPSSA